MRRMSLLFLVGTGCFVVGGLAASQLRNPVAAAPNELASSDTPRRPTYQLLMANTTKGWDAIRYKPETGEAWTPDNNGRWVKIIEPAKLPVGDYEVKMTSFESTNSFMAMRIERGSGKVWQRKGGKWEELTEPQ